MTRWSSEGAGLTLSPRMTYLSAMASVIDQRDKLDAEPVATEAGYDVWKRAKIERGLEQSRNRSAMIPVDQVLRNLSLEG